MRYPRAGIRSRMGTALLSGAFACAPALAHASASSAGGESAVWATKKVSFVYRGFTARYSCDGLADNMRQVLVSLGARDLKISAAPCATPYGAPDPFPGVVIRMSVLEPAGSAAAQPVHAHWQMVDLTAGPNALRTEGACELLEQIRTSILPQFATRNVDYSSSCVPNELRAGAIRLRAEVLMPDAPPASRSVPVQSAR